jgi:hypothetical protein
LVPGQEHRRLVDGVLTTVADHGTDHELLAGLPSFDPVRSPFEPGALHPHRLVDDEPAFRRDVPGAVEEEDAASRDVVESCLPVAVGPPIRRVEIDGAAHPATALDVRHTQALDRGLFAQRVAAVVVRCRRVVRGRVGCPRRAITVARTARQRTSAECHREQVPAVTVWTETSVLHGGLISGEGYNSTAVSAPDPWYREPRTDIFIGLMSEYIPWQNDGSIS